MTGVQTWVITTVIAILWWGQHCGWCLISQSDRCTHMSDHNSHSNPLMRTTLWSVITCALPPDKPKHCADTLQDQKQDRSCSGLGQWFCFPVLGFAFSITPSALFYIFSATFLFFFFFSLTVHCISFLCSTTFFDHALCTFSTFYHIFDSALSSFSTFYHIFLQCAIYLFYILPHFFTAYCVPFLLSTTFFPVCLIVFKQAQR